MRILHVISTLKMGGAEHLMVDLLPALRDFGNDVELLLINGEDTPYNRQLKEHGILIHSLQVNGRIYSPTHIYKARKFLKSYDIIHTHTFPCQIMMALAKATSSSKCHLVTTEHSTSNHRRNKIYLKPIDKWMYRQYDKIICITEKSKECLVNYLGVETNVMTINNGIDIKKFYNPIKQELPHRITLTMVASMRDAKDQDTVIKAMMLLDDKYRLQLVGDGYRREELKSLVRNLNLNNRVVFMGTQSDIPSILRESDIIISSSHWEGFGLAAVEGMAAGKPIIASDVPGLGDIVRGYGVVFPVGDFKQLALAIKRLSEDMNYYQDIANCCQKRAHQFDIRIMAQKYNELYKTL